MSAPKEEPFASLLHPGLSTNTDAFLSVYRNGMARTNELSQFTNNGALTRFEVGSMTLNKNDQTPSEHELISVKSSDNATKQPCHFFIERNGATPAQSKALLSDSPHHLGPASRTTSLASAGAMELTSSLASAASTRALESVTQVAKGQASGQRMTTASSVDSYPLNELPALSPTTHAAASASLRNTSTVSLPVSATHPDSPATHSDVSHLCAIQSDASLHAIQSAASSVSAIQATLLSTTSDALLLPAAWSNTTQIPPASQHTLGSKISLAATRTLHSSSRSFEGPAEDRILGCGMFVGDESLKCREIGHITRQLVPKEPLYLFELGILIDVVHNEAPNYSLLGNQCYWFANTIFDIIYLLYGNKLNDKLDGRLIPSEYLPNLAGRWNNVLIAAPKDDVLQRVAIKFLERRQEEFLNAETTLKHGLQRELKIQALQDTVRAMQIQLQALMQKSTSPTAGPSSSVNLKLSS